jgi:hypothetical protein
MRVLWIPVPWSLGRWRPHCIVLQTPGTWGAVLRMPATLAGVIGL